MSAGALHVEPHFAIPRHELTVRATRAGGPGGQHVNTSSTRIELLWNVEQSRAPTAEQRARLRERLASRMDAAGNIRVVASAFRSQHRNREDAEDRLAALLRRALHVPKVRRKTKPHRGAVEGRLENKRRASEKKKRRRAVADD